MSNHDFNQLSLSSLDTVTGGTVLWGTHEPLPPPAPPTPISCFQGPCGRGGMDDPRLPLPGELPDLLKTRKGSD